MTDLIQSLASKYNLQTERPTAAPSANAQLYRIRRKISNHRKESAQQAREELYQTVRTQFLDEWAKRSMEIQEAISNRMPPAGYKRGGSLIVQLSDLHFGACVFEGPTAVYNMEIAAKRLMLYAEKVKDLQISTGATKLYICLTGDLIESRMGKDMLDKVANFDGAQTLAMLRAASVLIQFIDDLHSCGQFSEFFIHGVAGNEARLTSDQTYGRTTACENYDCVINGLISNEFQDRPATTVGFGVFDYVVEVEDLKILLLHGHTMRGQLSQKSTSEVLSEYQCDFGLSGHIHFPLTQFNWSRSGCLVGNDDYAKNGLNLKKGRASQTVIHVQGGSRAITQIDLNDPGEIVGYNLPLFSGAFGSIEMQHTKQAA